MWTKYQDQAQHLGERSFMEERILNCISPTRKQDVDDEDDDRHTHKRRRTDLEVEKEKNDDRSDGADLVVFGVQRENSEDRANF
eukprot:14011992-Heterocapsa_arctica.AAC.1